MLWATVRESMLICSSICHLSHTEIHTNFTCKSSAVIPLWFKQLLKMLYVFLRAFRKRNFFPYQSVKLSNLPPVPTMYPCQIKTKSKNFCDRGEGLKSLGFDFYLAWILSGDSRPVGQINSLIRKKLRFQNALVFLNPNYFSWGVSPDIHIILVFTGVTRTSTSG